MNQSPFVVIRRDSCVRPDSQRYFSYYYSETDVFENVNKRELELGAASVAAIVHLLDKYLVSEGP